MRILYVEDHDELRETIGMLMEGPGRSVVSCASAEEALAHEERESFDVLVTDVSLPGMSGTDLARVVLGKDRDRCVVLCTGYDLGTHPAQWGSNVRTLLKPFDIEELDALLVSVQASVQLRAPV